MVKKQLESVTEAAAGEEYASAAVPGQESTRPDDQLLKTTQGQPLRTF
jgi:hypothetical protein